MSRIWFRPVFVCPECSTTSFNPNDIRENYCGRCHKFFPEEPINPDREPDPADEYAARFDSKCRPLPRT